MEERTGLKDFVERVDSSKKKNPKDLSSDQDLTIALMNLISIEEHLVFSGAKTSKSGYYDMIKDIRELRKNLMLKVIPSYEGEVWCISKHLLATSMRLMEVGTKQQSMGKDEDAYELFNQAYDLYCLFWGLNMGLIEMDGVQWQEEDEDKLKARVENIQAAVKVSGAQTAKMTEPDKQTGSKQDTSMRKDNGNEQGAGVNSVSVQKGGMFQKLKDVVKKAVDCCIE